MKKAVDMAMVLEKKRGDITPSAIEKFNDEFIELVERHGMVCGGGYKDIEVEDGDYAP